MTNWPLVTLGEHVDLKVGFAFKSAEFTSGSEDVRLVRGSNIGQGRLKWDQARRLPVRRSQDYQPFFLEPGDVVIAMDRPWIDAGLKWAVITEADCPALLVQRVARLRGSSTLLQEFIRYIVGGSEFSAFVRSKVTGVNVPHVSGAQIGSFEFRLPPLEYQHRVVEVLGAVDRLIDNNRRRIETLEAMAELIYREWFVRFRFPGHEDNELVTSDLGPIPTGWEVQPFLALAKFVNGFAFKPSVHWQDVGFPIVKIKELKNGVAADTPRYHGEDIDDKYFVFSGDVLFSWSADLDAYVWGEGPALLNQHVFVVRSNALSGLFLFHSLREHMGEFRSRAQGTTMKHIKRSALKEVKTIVPDERTHDLFESIVGPMLALKLNLITQNRVIRGTRDLLLPRLISGRLDVSKLDLELETVG